MRDLEVTEQMAIEALRTRWLTLYPFNDWVPKWTEKDKEAMKKAIEAALRVS